MNRHDGGEFVLHTLAARMRAIEATGPWQTRQVFEGQLDIPGFGFFAFPAGGRGIDWSCYAACRFWNNLGSMPFASKGRRRPSCQNPAQVVIVSSSRSMTHG
jgi:hypothetical protein